MIEITGSIEHCQSAQGMVRCFVGWASFGLREDHKGVRSLPLLRLQTLLAFSELFTSFLSPPSLHPFSLGGHR